MGIIKFTQSQKDEFWIKFVEHYLNENWYPLTDTFVKCVHTGSVENKQLSFTFMERLEQAKEEAVAVQDFGAACDIRNLMDEFKKAWK